jgi:hypothetical protein
MTRDGGKKKITDETSTYTAHALVSKSPTRLLECIIDSGAS